MFGYAYVPLSYPPGLWGAYADYMYLDPHSIVHPISKDLPANIAVMFNPIGAGFRWAVEIPETGANDTVLILGPGQRGLASVIAARAAGAAKIIVTGLTRDAKKLALAKELGADHVIDVAEHFLKLSELLDKARYFTLGIERSEELDGIAEGLECFAHLVALF